MAYQVGLKASAKANRMTAGSSYMDAVVFQVDSGLAESAEDSAATKQHVESVVQVGCAAAAGL